MKFLGSPSSESGVVVCGWKDTVRRTDMTKLTVAFRNLANARDKKKRGYPNWTRVA